MNLASALHIFTLGVKYGVHQGQLGFEPNKMLDDDVAPVLQAGFEKYIDEIQRHAKTLNAESNYANWYAQNWTAQQSFRFGLLAGFAEYPVAQADKKGIKILTEQSIDKLTQLQFRQCKPFGEE